MFGRFKKNVEIDCRSGLSIDDSRIAFARVQKLNSGKLQLAALTFDGAGIDEKWAHQLAARMDNIDPARSQVTSVLPDGSYQLLLVDIPNVPADEVNSAARWQIKDLLDFPVDDTVVELFEMPQVSTTAEHKAMAYAVATRRSSIEEHIELLHGAGFSLNVIDIPELCTRNIATLLPQDADGVAFLHFTETHGILTVTRQGVLYLIRRIEKGRAAITSASTDTVAGTGSDTVPMLEIPVLEVHGSSDDESQSAAADDFIRVETENTIVLEIQRSLDYYESHFFGRPLTELVLAPGSDIGGLANSLSGQLGLTVTSLDFGKLFEMQSELMPAEQGACLLAVGAALRSDSLAA